MKVTAPIQHRLAGHGVKPAEYYPGFGYPSADLITKALKQGIRLVAPVLLDHSGQARAAEGFGKNAFTTDWKPVRWAAAPAPAGTPSHSMARTPSSSLSAAYY